MLDNMPNLGGEYYQGRSSELDNNMPLVNDDYKSQGSNEELQNQELKVEDDD